MNRPLAKFIPYLDPGKSVSKPGGLGSLKGASHASAVGSLRVHVDFGCATVDYRAPLRLPPYMSYRAQVMMAPFYL
jgi:hypothetical protein